MPDPDLKALFSANPAPQPRADLAADIMAQARAIGASEDMMATPLAANDNSWLRWAAGFAACALVGIFIWAQSGTTPLNEADQWEDLADNSGFSELYDWVHAEEG